MTGGGITRTPEEQTKWKIDMIFRWFQFVYGAAWEQRTAKVLAAALRVLVGPDEAKKTAGVIMKTDISQKDIDSRLRFFRHVYGLIQAEAAQKVGTKKTTWNTWELRSSIPNEAALCVLVDMGVSLDWLILGRGDMMKAAARSNEIIDDLYRRLEAALAELRG